MNSYHKMLLVKLGVFIALVANVCLPIRYWLETPHTFIIEASNPVVPEPIILEPTNPRPANLTVEEYIIHKFGEVDGERGLKMLKTCENSTLGPTRINWNSNGSWDYGVWQINSVHGFTQEELSDPYFNTDVAYEIYKRAGNSFYPWTCSYIIGEVPFYLR